eukprot:4414755-Pleurochrysis_carterae.AAC.1
MKRRWHETKMRLEDVSSEQKALEGEDRADAADAAAEPAAPALAAAAALETNGAGGVGGGPVDMLRGKAAITQLDATESEVLVLRNIDELQDLAEEHMSLCQQLRSEIS